MYYPMKAEPMTQRQIDRWLSGEIPRRHLALPFGGPIPSPESAKGVDQDFEWFDETTDFYGPYPALRQSRERLTDWHHVTFGDRTDPTGQMKGVIVGKTILDEDPSDGEGEDEDVHTGIWADLWMRAGDINRAKIAALARRGAQLYGSSQPVQAGVRIAKSGHIEQWPVRYHTITTAPQNTHAVMAPMKASALLTDPNLADLSVGALRAFLTGADDLGPDLSAIGLGDGPAREPGAKAGRVLSAVNEADIKNALEQMETAIDRLLLVMGRNRSQEPQENTPDVD